MVVFFFFFEKAILKVTWSQLCSKVLFNNYGRIDSSILKDTLQLKILRTLVKVCSNSFVKTWANLIKRKSMKVPGKLSVAQKFEPALQRTLHQNRWHLFLFPSLSLSISLSQANKQTNIASKFNPVLKFTASKCSSCIVFHEIFWPVKDGNYFWS